MKALRSWLTPNPVLVKELRSRMRGPRAFLTLTVALVINALLMMGMVSLFVQAGNTFGSMLSPQIGHYLFEVLVNFELLLVCTITPAITSGAISTEREKLTFEMLLATPLGPAKILWGKLLSALSYVILLIFAAIPLASLVFLFGGVAPLSMLKGLFILVVVAVTMGIYGLFLSALFGRTGQATVAGFVSVIALLLGPLIVMIFGSLFGSARITMPRLILVFSPISMLVSAVETIGSANNGGADSLFGFIGGQWGPSMNQAALTQIPRPIYHYSLVLCGGLSIVLFTLAVGLIHPARRFYLSKRNTLTAGAALFSFAVVMGAAFLWTAPRYEWVQAAGNGNPLANPAMVGAPPAPAIAQAYPALRRPDEGPAFAPTPVGVEAADSYPAPGRTPTPVATFDPKRTVTPTVITAQGAAMALQDQVAIFAAAARQVYWKDSSYSNPDHPFQVVYLVPVTNDRAGDPDGNDTGSVRLAGDLQAGISAALSDLPARVIWSAADAVPRDEQGRAVQEGGVMITFGNIRVQNDGTVHLPVSAFITPMIGAGQTYILQKVDGTWQVIGIYGTRWIS